MKTASRIQEHLINAFPKEQLSHITDSVFDLTPQGTDFNIYLKQHVRGASARRVAAVNQILGENKLPKLQSISVLRTARHSSPISIPNVHEVQSKLTSKYIKSVLDGDMELFERAKEYGNIVIGMINQTNFSKEEKRSLFDAINSAHNYGGFRRNEVSKKIDNLPPRARCQLLDSVEYWFEHRNDVNLTATKRIDSHYE